MDFLRRQEDATPSVPKQALGIEEFSFHVSIGVSDWILDGRWAMGDGRWAGEDRVEMQRACPLETSRSPHF